jgi:hypothetical protein
MVHPWIPGANRQSRWRQGKSSDGRYLVLEFPEMANIPGEQPDVRFCPKCRAELRKVPRNEMRSSGYKRKNGDIAPETHTYECTASACKTRFEINEDRVADSTIPKVNTAG